LRDPKYKKQVGLLKEEVKRQYSHESNSDCRTKAGFLVVCHNSRLDHVKVNERTWNVPIDTARAFFYEKCPNGECVNGGFDLTKFVDSTIKKRPPLQNSVNSN
jgi:hypothetical protein